MISDSQVRYGFVSRFFHWFMALGFAWMLFTATSRFIDKDSALTKAVFAYHPQVGFTILILAILRILWAIVQRPHRPLVEGAAKLGHVAMYVLMVVIPTLALLRTIGGGRAFTYWNTIPIISKSEREIEWMVQLGNNFHGLLGWTLFALIIGHILFAIKHKVTPGDENVMPRMWGK